MYTYMTFQQATLLEHSRACSVVVVLAMTDLGACCCTSEELISAAVRSMPRKK